MTRDCWMLMTCLATILPSAAWAGEATPPPPFVEQVGVVETAIRPGVEKQFPIVRRTV